MKKKKIFYFCFAFLFLMIPCVSSVIFAGENHGVGLSFESYSNKLTSLVNENYDDIYTIRFNKDKELVKQNDLYMVSQNVYQKHTGTKINVDENDALKITTSQNNVAVVEKTNQCSMTNVSVQSANKETFFSVNDVSKDLGYEVHENENEIILTRPFQTKRLIVKTDKKIDSCGASKSIINYNNQNIYQYETEEETEKAYEYFSNSNKVEWVNVDSIVWAETPVKSEVLPIETKKTHNSWGYTEVGADKYGQYLTNNIGTANLKDVVVAVLDTGIDSDHPFFAGRIAEGGRRFFHPKSTSSQVNNDGHFEDDNFRDANGSPSGHGTHVSGTICDLTLPNVKILPIKVLDGQGNGTSLTAIYGMEYVIRLNVDVNYKYYHDIIAINMSLGGLSNPDTTDAYATAVDIGLKNGVITVVAAGNDGRDAIVESPANAPLAITVSAIGKSLGSYYFPSWSNWGNIVDVCAPGDGIVSAKIGGGILSLSGTSMATPHVAGCVALLASDPVNQIQWTNAGGSNKNETQIKAEAQKIVDLICQNVVDLGPDGKDNHYGYGLVDISRAYVNGSVGEVAFSIKEPNHTEAFSLQLRTASLDAEIYYTLDGSSPELQEDINGIIDYGSAKKYTGPITIKTTSRIKARAYIFEAGHIISRSNETQMTYYFGDSDVEYAFVVSPEGVLTDYNGILTSVVVPSSVDGVNVVAIGENAFKNTEVENLTLASTVIKIEKNAFKDNKVLRTITAPGVVDLGEDSFMNCIYLESLPKTSFPKLKVISAYAFSGCSGLTQIELPSVEVVKNGAFYMINPAQNSTIINHLQKVLLPNVLKIEKNAFANCNKLENLFCPLLEKVDSFAFNNTKILNLNLPSVKYVGNSCFYGNMNIESALLPEVEVIGDGAFEKYSTYLSNVVCPKVKYIGQSAFDGCSNLDSIDLPNVETIMNYAFRKCNIQTFTCPKLQRVGVSAFEGNPLLNKIELCSVETIEAGAFKNNSKLSDVTLSPNIVSIGDSSFEGIASYAMFKVYSGTEGESFALRKKFSVSYLNNAKEDFIYENINNEIVIKGYSGQIPENLVIPSYIDNKPVVKIGNNAFENCLEIQTLNLSMAVEIGDNAFASCENLVNVSLPKIQTIGQSAFASCKNIQSIEINNVQEVGAKAFEDCLKLKEIHIGDKITFVGEKAFGYTSLGEKITGVVLFGYDDNAFHSYASDNMIHYNIIVKNFEELYVRKITNTEYSIAAVDDVVTGRITVPSQYKSYPITKIDDGAFANCAFLEEIVLPSSIQTIGVQAFFGCVSLEKINLDKIYNIEEGAFEGCSLLKYIDIPQVQVIGKEAFSECSTLEKVTLDKTTIINYGAFKNCFNLIEVEGKKIQMIGNDAFLNDAKLEKIDLSAVAYLGDILNVSTSEGVFVGCDKLTEMYLPKVISFGKVFPTTLEKLVLGKDFEKYTKQATPQKTIVYGYQNVSKAQMFAKDNNNIFRPIDDFKIVQDLFPEVLGNINENCVLRIAVSGFEIKYTWYKENPLEPGHYLAFKGHNSNELSLELTKSNFAKYYVVAQNWDGMTLTSKICSVKANENTNIFSIVATSEGSGTITPAGEFSIQEGADKLYTFTPADGFKVSSILIDDIALSEQNMIYAVNNGYLFHGVTQNHTIKVIFTEILYTFTIENDVTKGEILADKTFVNMHYGEQIIFTIIVKGDFQISKVSVNNVPIEINPDNTFKLTANEDKVITVEYKTKTPVVPDNPDDKENKVPNFILYIFIVIVVILVIVLIVKSIKKRK